MGKIKEFLKIIKPFVNKYTIVVIAFLAILLFSKYNLIERFRLLRNVNQLEKEKKQFEDNIEEAKKQLYQLNTTDENLERMARENYRMHKEDEEIFIINEEELKID